MSTATDVIGYTFDADTYCPTCIRRIAAFDSEQHGQAAEYMSLDTLLARWADRLRRDGMDLDPTDERTYDSGDFPKVVFADTAHDVCSAENGYEPGQCGDQCGYCGQPLDHECPNTPDG